MKKYAALAKVNNMDYREHIPIDAYKKKFLKSYIETNPYRVSKNDIIGTTIINEISNPSYLHDNRINLNHINYSDSLEIIIPESYISKFKIKHISFEAIKAINNYIDRLFDFHFKRTVHFYFTRNQDEKIKNVISDFLEEHNLTEDDIAYETLKKKYYRFRSNKVLKSVN